jgi:2-polyprenyl-3-methyl-5-hydroxy-6-metoxy-1,4-benzoquinol methylase
MPTVDENQEAWNRNYQWIEQGEEWSSEWGGSEAQWFGAILQRIHAFLPTATILEIAPGFGRWTKYLKECCEHLIVVDLAENCIKACQERFASDSHIAYYVNDGKSLAMIQDKSVDFVFSFDSLVHAETDVIEGYLNQLAMKLKPNGVGFLHHSNIGTYQQALSLVETIPSELRESVVNRVFLGPTHWRARSMTSKLFEGYCDAAGLQCISQELVNWGTDGLLIDCFSLFTPKSSIWSRSNKVVENTEFMEEAHLIRRLSHAYTLKSFQANSETDSQTILGAAVRSTVTERKEQLAALPQQESAGRNPDIDSLTSTVSEQAAIIEALRGAASAKDAALSEQAATIQAMRSSTSWRLTRPVRALKRLIHSP